jgi:hypothetical protein
MSDTDAALARALEFLTGVVRTWDGRSGEIVAQDRRWLLRRRDTVNSYVPAIGDGVRFRPAADSSKTARDVRLDWFAA